MKKPLRFREHPVSYVEAKNAGAYRAVCADIIDGDTFDFEVDVGLYLYPYERIRLDKIDVYEIYGAQSHPLGRAAKEWCEEFLLNKPCLLFTNKDRKSLDRFIADIKVYDVDDIVWDVAEELRLSGFEKERTE